MKLITQLRNKLVSVKVGALLGEVVDAVRDLASDEAATPETREKCADILMSVYDACQIIEENVLQTTPVTAAKDAAGENLKQLLETKKDK